MRSGLIALILSASGAGLFAQQDPKQSGPTTLVIQYRCAPAQRSMVRQAMLENGLRRFQTLKNEGVLTDYHILFSRYVDTNNWDMLAVMQFASFADVSKWTGFERRTPAGLPPDALQPMFAVSTYPVDLMRRKASETTAEQPVYLVIPYAISVPPQAYLQYVDDYVQPQFNGWIGEGILTSYQIFLQRYTAARPWDSLILLEYKNDESLGARESVVAKVRQQLQSNPVWRAISNSKQNIRVEKEAVIAEELRIER